MTRHSIWGVDIGGTTAVIGRLGPGGSFRLAEVLDTGPCRTFSTVMGAIAGAIRRLDPSPRAVGVGIAGLVDTTRGYLLFSPNLPLWSDKPVASHLSRLLDGVPVHVDNDCNVFAFGALAKGLIPDRGLWLFITLGTGIGGTILLDGTIVYGTGTAGEFGHMTLREGGRKCTCGLRGCWERYAARDALIAFYDGKTEPRLLAGKAAKGEEKALMAFREYGMWLGRGMANLAKCFAPEGFYLAGGLSANHPFFLEAARKEYALRCPNAWSVSILDDSSTAGAYGAAAMASGIC